LKKIGQTAQPPRSAVEPKGNAGRLAHDAGLYKQAWSWWLAANWASLCSIDPEAVARHPQRAQLAAWRAAAWQQRADTDSAQHAAEQALAWGCTRRQLSSTLVAAARHTLARGAWLAGRESHARAVFAQCLLPAVAASEAEHLVQTRIGQVAHDCEQERKAAATRAEKGAAGAAARAPAWLTKLVERCLGAPDLHERVDYTLATELRLADDRLLFLLCLSDRMLARGDKLSAIDFLQSARWSVGDASPSLLGQLMSKLAALGAAGSALDLAMQQLLSATTPGLTSAGANTLALAYQRLRDEGGRDVEHGHNLLLAHLQQHIKRLKGLAAGRTLTVIEIGTTREDVPGQGSTRHLAQYCLQEGLAFITVDMDPHNSRMAREVFARLGADFEAVTAKGEDYLRDRTGPVDLVFLDAYDFDHGKHSSLRQSRYERYLGGRIDEQLCHLMHLHCAQSLAGKLWEHGVICIDDTWLDGGNWTAKGTLAMPHLLSNGFALVEARNRAALLARSSEMQP
jgi:hypothetical protein